MGDVVMSPANLPDQLAERARQGGAAVVVLPLREQDGIGIYSQESVTLVKMLRAGGVAAAYLHSAEARTFEVRKGVLADAALAVGLGIVSSAVWDGVKAILKRRRDRSELDLTYVQLTTSEGQAAAVRCTGSTQDVLDAIDRLRSDANSGSRLAARPPRLDLLSERVSSDSASARQTALPAGPDDDLRAEYLREQVSSRRTSGDALLASAALTLASGDAGEAEREARDALVFLARSLDWAEDSEFEVEAHRRLDEAGSWVRKTFGCQLQRDGHDYLETCPVALGHNRIGLSVGGVAIRVCSLCGQDLSECEHMPGESYEVPGGPGDLGWCRICLAEACDHTPDDVQRVSVVGIIQEMKLQEISLVAKPANPEARLTAVGVSTEELHELLGSAFTPGMEVSCDKCLHPCQGLTRHVL